MADLFIQLSYLLSTLFFVVALRSLGKPETARRGMHLAALGMMVAVAATLLNSHILSFQWIIIGLVLGSIIGYPLGMWVPMTSMPQRIAFSHAFGALAVTLVGIGEYYVGFQDGNLTSSKVIALSLEVLFGALTVSGSLMAFGKLQGILPGRPIVFRFQNTFNLILLIFTLFGLVWLAFIPSAFQVFIAILIISFFLGILFVLRIGGADMPVVISILNSYAGLAAVATGFAINNNILIVVGALDGTSGMILSISMSRAMNRSFKNVLFDAFGKETTSFQNSISQDCGELTPINAEDAALRLAYAERLIIVPGFGLAVAQAQHQVRELADIIESQGCEIRFAIHPVAGRMPGHMNVLLAEAGVPYDKLVDMEDINERFSETDVAVVIGANDIVNPAAQTNTNSPIYGMPILKVADAKSILVLKRGQGKGFSGVENDLFVNPKTVMLYGDARQTLMDLCIEVKNALL